MKKIFNLVAGISLLSLVGTSIFTSCSSSEVAKAGNSGDNLTQATSTTTSKKQKEFEEILNSDLNEVEKFNTIYEFSNENLDHFSSKVYLAEFYLEDGQMKWAERSLNQAEKALKKAKADDKTPETLVRFYECEAKFYSAKNQLDKALSFADQAIALGDVGIKSNYIKAIVLIGMNNFDDALTCIETAYAVVPEEMDEDLTKVYMKILESKNSNTRFVEVAKRFIDSYRYFGGFGDHAAKIFEAEGQYFDAILLYALAFDYNSAKLDYNGKDLNQFLEETENRVKSATGKDYYDQVKNAADCVKAVYGKGTFPEVQVDSTLYKIFKARAEMKANPTVETVNNLGQYEIFVYPITSFYWDLYEAMAVMCKNENKGDEELIPLLENIINVSNDTTYAVRARKLLGEKAGLSEEEGKKILVPNEIYEYALEFLQTKDSSKMEPIYELLSISECRYTEGAVILLNNAVLSTIHSGNPDLLSEMYEKEKNSSGILQERLKKITKLY